MSTVHDWHPPRTTHRFTGYTPDGTKVAGLVVHAVTHTPFPTTEDDRTASGVNRVSATILGIPKLGFVRAPYKKAPSKPGKKGDKRGEREPSAAKPLLELGEHTQTGEPLSVRIYSFFKANSNYDRGERDEGSASELRVGQVLTFALTEYTFGGDGKDKEVFPPGTTGVLPPATVVELVLNPSHNQSNGYGVKLSRARPLSHTLYSYMGPGALEALPRTAEEARALAAARLEQSPGVANCLDRARTTFYCAVDPTARTVDVPGADDLVRIECPRSGGAAPTPGVRCVDVGLPELLRFTNAPPGDVAAARTLVDLAIAAGALKLVVTHDPYFNKADNELSPYRGVPLVDAEALLAPVEAEGLEGVGLSATFPAPWHVPHDPRLSTVALRVTTVPRSHSAAPEPPCPDLSLVAPAYRFERGYRVYFGNPGSGDEQADDAFYVLGMVFNAGGGADEAQPAPGGGGGTPFKRIRLDED